MSNEIFPHYPIDEDLIKIRFNGENLFRQGVPIYELGETFIAFQRIVNKCFLLEKDRLTPGAKLIPSEREICALQIRERTRESDAYGLVALLMHPAYGGILQSLIASAIFGIGCYVYKKVFFEDSDERDRKIVSAIRNEVSVIFERVGNVGGIEEIEMIPNSKIGTEPLLINEDCRDYLRELPYREIFGDLTTIEGYITKILPRRRTIDLKIGPKWFVTVQLDEQQFDRIRRSKKIDNLIRITGRPVYQGMKIANFKKLEPQDVTITRVEPE